MKRAAVVLFLSLLTACTSAKEKADAAEAHYDQAMSIRAYPVARNAIREATGYYENEPRYWLKLGRVQLQLGALAEALEAYKRVLDYDPGNIEALTSTAELSAAGGDYDAAKSYAGQLLKIQPDDVRGRIVLVATAVRERRFADALTQIDDLVARGTVTDDLFLLKSRALEGLRRPADAVALLEERDKATPNSLPILSELVALYKRQGNADGMRRAQARLAFVTPEDPQLQLAAAQDFRQAGNVTAARATIDTLQQANKDNPDVQRQVVDYLRDSGGDAEAQAAARRAAQGGGPGVKIAMAQALLDLGQPAEALAMIAPIADGMADIDPGTVVAHVVYANALAAAGQTAKARAVIDRVLAFDQTNSEALLRRGRLALGARQMDRALQDAQLLVANDAQFEAGQILLADVYAARGERTLADVAYVRARNRFPDSSAAMAADAGWRIATGRPGQAVELARDYAKHHPGSVKARTALVEICRKAGDRSCSTPAGGSAK